MSYTKLLGIWPGEKIETLKEYHNGWGSGPYVWNQLAVRYLKVPPYQYAEHFCALSELYKRPDIPVSIRAVMLSTHDRAIVLAQDYKRFAADIRAFCAEFPVNDGHANHWPRLADDIEGLSAEIPSIGIYLTTSGDNLYEVMNGEGEVVGVHARGQMFNVYFAWKS